MDKSHKKVLLVANTSWYLYNFRFGVIRHFQAQCFDTVAVAPSDAYAQQLRNHGCHVIDVFLEPRGINPLNDVRYFWQLYKIYADERPSLIIHYTIKPNIYGSLAAMLLGFPSVAVVSGAGHAFVHKGWLNRIAKLLLRTALRYATEVWFVNPEDRALFVSEKLVSSEKAYLFPGEGIDTHHFRPAPSNQHTASKKIVFLLSARLLREKGIELYARAAKQLKSKYPHAEFRLLGFLLAGNPAFVSKDEIECWKDYINYLGETHDVLPYVQAADCVVLPSLYREGTPRTLLEAASLEKPVIATDSVGCRQIVEDGVTGFLVQPNSVSDLVEKLERIITMPEAARLEMGKRARLKMIKEFDESLVLRCYDDMLHRLKLL
ncbi:MAG: glycosyltransferase family 4 protein [Candidatus Thermochlorobacter sp.]